MTSVLTTLVSFTGANGAGPGGSLIADANGDLFGTTTNGGDTNGDGTVFEIQNTASGYAGTPTTLVSFTGGFDFVANGGRTIATTLVGGKLELGVGAVTNGGIVFAGSGGTLQIDGTTMPTDTISGFAAGDTIYLRDVSFDSAGTATLEPGNVLQTVENGVTYNLQLDPGQS